MEITIRLTIDSYIHDFGVIHSPVAKMPEQQTSRVKLLKAAIHPTIMT